MLASPIMGEKPVSTESVWDVRLHRARHLHAQAASDEVWRLYVPTLDFQSQLAKKTAAKYQPELGLRDQIDVEMLATALDPLLDIALEVGPRLLCDRARYLQSLTHKERVQAFRRHVEQTSRHQYETDDFFFRACLQPFAENLQVQIPTIRNEVRNRCPECSDVPQLAFLRPVGEGSANWLQCSFCLREWEFRRLMCVWCGQENNAQLPRFSVADCAHVYLTGCDVCHRYLKTVDLSIDGRAVPLIDEVATTAMDIWAAERGFQKTVPNLMGF